MLFVKVCKYLANKEMTYRLRIDISTGKSREGKTRDDNSRIDTEI